MIPIIGTSMTKFGDLWEMSIRDLIKESGKKALDDSGVRVSEVDAVYVANCFSSRAQGIGQLSSVVFEELGIKNSVVINGDISGAVAIQQAAESIKSRKTSVVLVIGAEKLSDLKSDEVTELTKELIDEADARSGSTLFANWALITGLYAEQHNVKAPDMNSIPIINHRNAKENQFAQFRSEITHEKIESSPFIAEPLRLMGCASLCDGAAAIVMCSPDFEKIHNRKAKGFFVSGATSFESGSLGKRKNIVHFDCAKEAFEKSFGEAKVAREKIKAVESHDICAASEILSIESMGFVKSNGIDFIKAHEGMINRSGGLKACGHAIGATGVRQAIDVISRLGKSEFGIAQTLSGAASGCSVNVFGGYHA
jgi:acetyl-CoA C-acetyltransferase